MNRRPVIFAALAVAAVALSGCQSLLKDLQTCERHYDGTVAGGGIAPPVLAGKALVDCCPVGYVASPDHTGCVQPPKPVALLGAVVGRGR